MKFTFALVIYIMSYHDREVIETVRGYQTLQECLTARDMTTEIYRKSSQSRFLKLVCVPVPDKPRRDR